MRNQQSGLAALCRRDPDVAAGDKSQLRTGGAQRRLRQVRRAGERSEGAEKQQEGAHGSTWYLRSIGRFGPIPYLRDRSRPVRRDLMEERRMRSSRSAPVLLIVFGMLIGLIAISGIGALHRARETYRAVSTLNEHYRRTDRILNSIASGIYMAGLVARDYLLDPANTHAPEYRHRLVEERSSMEKEFAELQTAIRTQDRPQLEALRVEVEGYWDALDPLFEWTPSQKATRAFYFLRQEILPRRPASARITTEIARLTQANLDQQRDEIDRRQAEMAAFIERMLVITVVLRARDRGRHRRADYQARASRGRSARPHRDAERELAAFRASSCRRRRPSVN